MGLPLLPLPLGLGGVARRHCVCVCLCKGERARGSCCRPARPLGGIALTLLRLQAQRGVPGTFLPLRPRRCAEVYPGTSWGGRGVGGSPAPARSRGVPVPCAGAAVTVPRSHVSGGSPGSCRSDSHVRLGEEGQVPAAVPSATCFCFSASALCHGLSSCPAGRAVASREKVTG